jgi:hypothetical protein
MDFEMLLVKTPPGAALFRVVQIKPADNLGLAPYEDLSKIVFWYDPDPCGHSSGLKPVYGDPLPVGIAEVVSTVVEVAESPATDMHGFTARDRLNLINRAEQVRADALVRAGRIQAREREDAVQSGRLLTEAQRTHLLQGDLSEVALVLLAISVVEDAAPVTGAAERFRAPATSARCERAAFRPPAVIAEILPPQII